MLKSKGIERISQISENNRILSFEEINKRVGKYTIYTNPISNQRQWENMMKKISYSNGEIIDEFATNREFVEVVQDIPNFDPTKIITLRHSEDTYSSMD